jgi:hypothetical protein
MSFLRTNDDGTVTGRRNSKKKKTYPRKAEGIVYIIKSKLRCGTVLYKIGYTTRRGINERLAENLLGFFTQYRYIPETDVRKYSKTPYYSEVEALLHRGYNDVRYVFDKKFGGSTEWFHIEDEESLIKAYEEIMADPLDYVTPTKSASAKQEELAEEDATQASMMDIEPVNMMDIDYT